MSAESSAATLLLTQVSGAGAVPHAMTTHGWHNGPGAVSLQVTWGLPWLPEC